jgi:hypothetical protein
MATTTPNYGWPVPTSSDLVKNGATAIEALGDAADATMATMTPKSTFTAKGSIAAATAASTPANLAVGSNGNSIVADSTTATGLAYAPSGLDQPIINGAFDIAQRGTTTGTMSTTYLLDRWAASTSSGVGTQAQVTGLTVGTEVFRYAWKFTALGAYTFVQMGTQIEFANCYQLQNQQVTISFYAQANNTNAASTSLIVRTRTGASVDASVLFTGTVVSTNQTITTTGTRYSITRTLPATFGALSLEFASGTSGIAGDGFTLTGVQIDKGSVALPFRRAGGTIQGELAACQRYYYRFTPTATTRYGSALADSTTTALGLFVYPVTMRTNPTALEQSGVATDYSVAGVATTVCSIVPVFSSANVANANVGFTVTAGLVAGQALQGRLLTGGYLGWSAEL